MYLTRSLRHIVSSLLILPSACAQFKILYRWHVSRINTNYYQSWASCQVIRIKYNMIFVVDSIQLYILCVYLYMCIYIEFRYRIVLYTYIYILSTDTISAQYNFAKVRYLMLFWFWFTYFKWNSEPNKDYTHRELEPSIYTLYIYMYYTYLQSLVLYKNRSLSTLALL